VNLPDLHLIGSGRLAHSLAIAWEKAGGRIASVWSRNSITGQALALKHNASWLTKVNDARSPGWLMLAVKDEAVREIAASLSPQDDLLVLHASGTLPLAVLSQHPRTAVLWPLQSMQLIGNDWTTIPLFIEAGIVTDMAELQSISGRLSTQLYSVTSQERLYYHLAAVMAGNFSNALYQSVFSMLTARGLDPKVLLPQLQAGLNGLMDEAPATRQTGPAVRKDEQVMEQHLTLLAQLPELAELYRIFSKLIQKQADSLR